MIPFQIDERVILNDPDLSREDDQRERHFYVTRNLNSEYDAANSARADTLPYFDKDDELVFLLKDAGDREINHLWIDDDDSRKYPRYELSLTDPISNETAYVYLFRSVTMTMPESVANRYAMSFDPETHTAQSLAYSVRINRTNGFLSDIVIKPPYGNGQDIFDAQKLRLNGHFELGLGFDLDFYRNDANSATESILYLYDNADYLAFSEKPVVRVFREVRQALKLGSGPLENTQFYVKTKFYPFSASFEGGALLDPEALKETFDDPSIEIAIEIDYLRQSWDFNANASGMTFFNEKNNAIPVDGVMDSPDTGIDTEDDRLRVWSMLTGNQGTFFNWFELAETDWDDISLYYYDNKAGGQMDNDMLIASDSGEPGCYGEHGLRFIKAAQDKPLNIDFSFTAFFMEPNQNRSTGEYLKDAMIHRLETGTHAQTYVTSVESGQTRPDFFGLQPNFPNPFNMDTRISFILDRSAHVKLSVLDEKGRTVRILSESDYNAGTHQLQWNGCDTAGQTLPSGVYFVRLETREWRDQIKITMLK